MHFSDEMLSLKSLTNCISLQTLIFEICMVGKLLFRGKPTLHYLHWSRKRLVLEVFILSVKEIVDSLCRNENCVSNFQNPTSLCPETLYHVPNSSNRVPGRKIINPSAGYPPDLDAHWPQTGSQRSFATNRRRSGGYPVNIHRRDL